MGTAVEVAVYIHGVEGDVAGRSHDEEYRALHDGIRARNPSFPVEFIGIEWGWNRPGGAGSPDERLSDAQRLLGERTMAALDRQWDFTLNPARIVINVFRPIVFYNFGDMFYYVSKDGKVSVRQSVAIQILKSLNHLIASGDSEISLTLLGHSAGSIVAFDLLFYLFFSGESEDHEFLSEEQSPSGLAALRGMAQTGRLRVRRLFTFGSPIAPLACRSTAVVDILAAGKRLNPGDYGLRRNPFDDLLSLPRWVNMWDRDDPIGWPVEPLMENADGVVRDVYIDVSDLPDKAHDAYWRSSAVHKQIAAAW